VSEHPNLITDTFTVKYFGNRAVTMLGVCIEALCKSRHDQLHGMFIIQYLISKGANPRQQCLSYSDVTKERNVYPIELAAFSKWTELVQLLLPRAQMDLLLFAV
jgi:hypothetical protein